MTNESAYRAVVEKIITRGPYGPYAVARSDELGSITFSLDRAVWQEADIPEPGVYVTLSQIRRNRGGWRAKHGRYVMPSDEQQQSATVRQPATVRST